MIDIKDGSLKINDTLRFYPGFQFEDFKKTKYYNGQDGIRIIYLDAKQIINGNTYIVSIFFRNGYIYMISLINCDNEYQPEREKERKKLHDKILAEENIISGKYYSWGKVISEYDAKSNISSINVYYDSSLKQKKL